MFKICEIIGISKIVTQVVKLKRGPIYCMIQKHKLHYLKINEVFLIKKSRICKWALCKFQISNSTQV